MKSFLTIIITSISLIYGAETIVEYEHFSNQLSNVKVVELNPGTITVRTTNGKKELKYAELPIHVRHDLEVLNAEEAQLAIEREEITKELVHCLTPLKTDEELLEELNKGKFVAVKGTLLQEEGDIIQGRISRISHDWRKIEEIVAIEGGDGQPEMFDKKYNLNTISSKEVLYINTKGANLNISRRDETFTTLTLYFLGEREINENKTWTRLCYADEEEALKVIKEQDINRYNKKIAL